MTLTDEQVRAAIAAVIKAAQPDAAVYSWNALGHRLHEWPAMFRTADDATVHGWIVKRSGVQSEWKGNGGRVRQTWAYDVWGFYGFRPGKSGDNSDEEFAAIIDAVADGIRLSGKLGLDEVEDLQPLQYALISTIDCGEETLHFAQGRLTMMPCC